MIRRAYMTILLVDVSKIIHAYSAYITMTTTQDTKFQVLDMIQQRVNGYLIKPFEEADIIERRRGAENAITK